MGAVTRRWRTFGVRLLILLALSTVTAVARGDAADPPASPLYSFVVVDLPDMNGQLGSTEIRDMTDDGRVLADITRGPFAFLVDRFELTKIECPSGGPTAALSINSDAAITGFCGGGALGPLVGYLRGDDGEYMLLSVPGATLTEAAGLNDAAEIVGDYRDSAGKFHGFIWNLGGVITIDVPFSEAISSSASHINNLRQIVGFYVDANGNAHGFLYDGGFTHIEFPDSVSTVPSHITDGGQIVGLYADRAGRVHGFLLDQGVYATLDVPFPGVTRTEAHSINNRGQIVGRFTDSTSSRGFVATLVAGSNTSSTASATVPVTDSVRGQSAGPLNPAPSGVPTPIGRLPRASWIDP